jgi:hypothetical protein
MSNEVYAYHKAEDDECVAVIEAATNGRPEVLCYKQGYMKHMIDFEWTDIIPTATLCEFHSAKYSTDLATERDNREKIEADMDEFSKALGEAFEEFREEKEQTND